MSLLGILLEFSGAAGGGAAVFLIGRPARGSRKARGRTGAARATPQFLNPPSRALPRCASPGLTALMAYLFYFSRQLWAVLLTCLFFVSAFIVVLAIALGAVPGVPRAVLGVRRSQRISGLADSCLRMNRPPRPSLTSSFVAPRIRLWESHGTQP